MPKAKISLRENEQHLRKNKVLQKNYSIMRNDKIVGSAILDFDLKAYPKNWDFESADLKPSDMGIASLHIDKDQRGKGTGAKALRRIASVARKAKRKRLVLVVYNWNAGAKKFYKREGFEQIGESNYMGKRQKRRVKKVFVMAKHV
jgi:ribosomal protein S18 acetylase RimI-like enzyme